MIIQGRCAWCDRPHEYDDANVSLSNNKCELCKPKYWKSVHMLCEKNANRPLTYKTLNMSNILDNLKCMINNRKIEVDFIANMDDKKYPEEDYKIRKDLDSGAYNSAVVGVIEAGYGSKHDGDCFLIAISDEEMDKLLKEGKIQRLGSYI